MFRFIIFGNDDRQSALAQTLRGDGHQVFLWPQAGSLDEKTELQSIAVLPMPLYDAENRLQIPNIDENTLIELLKTTDFVVGGRIPETFRAAAAACGVPVIDYTTRDDFAITNALTTAEAAVEIAMHNRTVNLSGAHALIIGFGRIGQLLARLLDAMGVCVTVSARKATDFAWIRAYGYACADTRALTGLAAYDMIFNTVPAPVFGREQLELTREDALLIDLASSPGGIDRYAATLLGRRVIWALSLPGKYAPQSAARCSADSIYAILSEEDYG